MTSAKIQLFHEPHLPPVHACPNLKPPYPPVQVFQIAPSPYVQDLRPPPYPSVQFLTTPPCPTVQFSGFPPSIRVRFYKPLPTRPNAKNTTLPWSRSGRPP